MLTRTPKKPTVIKASLVSSGITNEWKEGQETMLTHTARMFEKPSTAYVLKLPRL